MVFFHANLFEFKAGWSDEIVYRQEILTFRETGFQGGYFSVDEFPAKFSGSRFGTHGPAFAFLMGGIIRLIGWDEFVFPFLNLAFICLSIISFLLLVKPDKVQTIFIFFIVGLYYPMLLYIPSLMQESFHHALAIMFTGLLIRATRQEKTSPWFKTFVILLTLVAALVRVTWAVVLFPFLYFFIPGRKKAPLSIIISLGFIVLMTTFYLFFTSPFTQGSFQSILDQPNMLTRFGYIATRFLDNLVLFLQWNYHGLELTYLFHYQFLFVLFSLFIFSRENKPLINLVIAILLLNLLVTLSLYNVGYYVDYRVLSPFLLMGLLTFATCIKRRKTTVLILLIFLFSTLFFLPGFFQNYRSFHVDHFGKNNDPVAESFGKALGTIQYKENVSPWCNSLLTNHGSFEKMRYLQPGIGLNTLLSLTDQDFQVKSHYLLVPKTFLEAQGLSENCSIVFESESDVFCERIDDDC